MLQCKSPLGLFLPLLAESVEKVAGLRGALTPVWVPDADHEAMRDLVRALALPKEVAHWSLTTLREKLVKIGAKVVRHGRYVTFQLAEVAVPRELFRKLLSLIDDLRRRPVPA